MIRTLSVLFIVVVSLVACGKSQSSSVPAVTEEEMNQSDKKQTDPKSDDGSAQITPKKDKNPYGFYFTSSEDLTDWRGTTLTDKVEPTISWDLKSRPDKPVVFRFAFDRNKLEGSESLTGIAMKVPGLTPGETSIFFQYHIEDNEWSEIFERKIHVLPDVSDRKFAAIDNIRTETDETITHEKREYVVSWDQRKYVGSVKCEFYDATSSSQVYLGSSDVCESGKPIEFPLFHGSVKLRLIATDGLNRRHGAASRYFEKVFNVDTYPPNTSFSVSEYAKDRSASATFVSRCTGRKNEAVSYCTNFDNDIEACQWQEKTAGYCYKNRQFGTYHVQLSLPDIEGSIKVYGYARDQAGNVTRLSDTTIHDSTPPVAPKNLTATSHPNFPAVSTKDKLELTYDTPADLSPVTHFCKVSSFGSVDTDPYFFKNRWDTCRDVMDKKLGQYNSQLVKKLVYVKAVDVHQRMAYSVVPIAYDYWAPDLYNNVTIVDKNVRGYSVQFKVKDTSDVSEVCITESWKSSSPCAWQRASFRDGVVSIPLPEPLRKIGNFNIYFAARDEVGNTSVNSYKIYKIDPWMPSHVNYLDPVAPYVFQSSNISVEWVPGNDEVSHYECAIQEVNSPVDSVLPWETCDTISSHEFKNVASSSIRYAIHIRAVLKNGGYSEVYRNSIVVDYVPPIVENLKISAPLTEKGYHIDRILSLAYAASEGVRLKNIRFSDGTNLAVSTSSSSGLSRVYLSSQSRQYYDGKVIESVTFEDHGLNKVVVPLGKKITFKPFFPKVLVGDIDLKFVVFPYHRVSLYPTVSGIPGDQGGSWRHYRVNNADSIINPSEFQQLTFWIENSNKDRAIYRTGTGEGIRSVREGHYLRLETFNGGSSNHQLQVDVTRYNYPDGVSKAISGVKLYRVDE